MLKLYKIPCITLISLALLLTVACGTLSNRSSDELAWPSPPAQPRIKWLSQWQNKNDFKKLNPVLETLMGPEPIIRFRRPQGVVADAAGNIYAADSESGLIFVFDFEKNDFRTLGEGILKNPIGLAIDNKKNILYIADSGQNKIFGLNKATGNIVVNIGGGIGLLKRPSGIAFDETRDRLYIADTKNHMIRVFDNNGTQLFTFGSKGPENGQFNNPSHIALDKNGNIFVVDTFNFRVQSFDPNGNFIKKFGRIGDSSGSFTRPSGIGIDSDGNVYVVDTAFNNFQIFSDNGRLLLWVGSPGKKPGAFDSPTGLFIDKKDTIYICDTFNKRIQVFKYFKEEK